MYMDYNKCINANEAITQCMCSATVMLRYELVLEEPDKIYFSGDDVKGHVSISLNSNITLQGMYCT